MGNASRDLNSLTALDRSVIARTAVMEAQGEGPLGVAAVLGVILNRLESEAYPDEVWGGVITPGAFSTWHEKEGIGHYEQLVTMTGENDHYRSARVLIEGMVKGVIENPVPYVTHYANEVKTATYYKDGKIPEDHWINRDVTEAFQYKNHSFYVNSLFRDEAVVMEEVNAAQIAFIDAREAGLIDAIYHHVIEQENTKLHGASSIAGRPEFPLRDEEHSALEEIFNTEEMPDISPAAQALGNHDVQLATLDSSTPNSIALTGISQSVARDGVEIG